MIGRENWSPQFTLKKVFPYKGALHEITLNNMVQRKILSERGTGGRDRSVTMEFQLA